MATAALHDLVSHVMDVFDLSDNPVDVRRAVRSCMFGYEVATSRHQWGTYDSQFSAYFNAAYDTGTVSIDTGGNVTLSGGTWPEWSELALVYVNDDRAYRVKDRVSSTVLKLENWTGETETGIKYVLRQDRVIIPEDVREVYDVWQEREDFTLRVVSQREFRDYDRPRIHSGADPYLVTFRSVTINGKHQTEMRVGPAVTTATELDVAYIRRPSMATVLSSKTASASSGVVTLQSPLPVGSSVVGCIVRHAGAVAPTPEFQFGIQSPMAATFEGIVESQTSTSVINVPGIPDFSDESIVISSVLDIPPFLEGAVKLFAEAQMARIGRGDLREYRTLMMEADDMLRYAMEQDAPYKRRGALPNIRVDRLESTSYIVEA